MRKLTIVIVCIMLITTFYRIFPIKISVANQPPRFPDDTEVPLNASKNVNISEKLSWVCEDPDGDPVTYDVYFGVSSPPELVKENLSDPSYDPLGDLNYSTHYFWKIIATDNQSASVEGPLWDFITKVKTNNPPNTLGDETPQNDSTNVSIDVILKKKNIINSNDG